MVVALHVRAWVEISLASGTKVKLGVALHVRAWVEIATEVEVEEEAEGVALHVRAWVEIGACRPIPAAPWSPSM